MADKRSIPIWLIAIGIYLHFLLPVNVLVAGLIAVDWLVAGRTPNVLAIEAGANGAFLGAVLLVAVLVLAADSVMQSRHRHRKSLGTEADPENSKDAVDRAMHVLATASAGDRLSDIQPRIQAIRRIRWNHADVRYRSIASDLEMAANDMVTPCLQDDRERRIAAQARLAATLDVVLDALRAEESRVLEDQDAAARTAARYLETKYSETREGFPD